MTVHALDHASDLDDALGGLLAAAADHVAVVARAGAWVEQLRRLADQGRLLFTVTDVVVVLGRAR